MTDTTTADDTQGQGLPDDSQQAHSGIGPSSPRDTPPPPSDVNDADAEQEAQSSNKEAANGEAAKYRRQLRETETERDALRETVASLRRADVERIAGATITKPEALWAAGVDVDDLLDDSGRIDPERVQSATVEAATRLGLVRRSRNNYVPGAGRTPQAGRGNSWDRAFAPQQ